MVLACFFNWYPTIRPKTKTVILQPLQIFEFKKVYKPSSQLPPAPNHDHYISLGPADLGPAIIHIIERRRSKNWFKSSYTQG